MYPPPTPSLVRRNPLPDLLIQLQGAKIENLDDWHTYVDLAIASATLELREVGKDDKVLKQIAPGMKAVGDTYVAQAGSIKGLVGGSAGGQTKLSAFDNLANAVEALGGARTATAIREQDRKMHTNWGMILGVGIPVAAFLGFGLYRLYKQLSGMMPQKTEITETDEFEELTE